MSIEVIREREAEKNDKMLQAVWELLCRLGPELFMDSQSKKSPVKQKVNQPSLYGCRKAPFS